MLVPPVSFYKGEQQNREAVETMKEQESKEQEPGSQDWVQREDWEKQETGNPKEEGGADPGSAERKEDIIGRITIRKLNLESAIIEGTGKKNLSHYVGHIPETAAIGQRGNCVLAGHRGGRNGRFFKELDRLEDGDAVEVTDREGRTYVYQVEESYVTDAFDPAVKNQGAESRLTLLTCEENGTKRLIVLCGLEEARTDSTGN